MADFTALKTAIQNAIKQNGNEEITGNILQDVLLAIVSTLGDGSINDLITALGSEATTRGNADATLQQNIDAEAQARQLADATLQQNIDAEAQARQLADSTLQGGINTAMQAINAINNAIANGCVYAGIATPSSTPASGKVFYLALTAGTYTNYGGLEVPQGINILKNNGSTWLLDSFLGIDDAPIQGSDNLVKSGGVASTYGYVISNKEFSLALLDKEDNIIIGVKRNGSILYGTDIPTQIKSYIEKIIRVITNNINDLEERAFKEVYNKEWSYLISDKEDKIVFGSKKNGDFVFGNGVPTFIKHYINALLKTNIKNTVCPYFKVKEPIKEGLGTNGHFAYSYGDRFSRYADVISQDVDKSHTTILRTQLSPEVYYLTSKGIQILGASLSDHATYTSEKIQNKLNQLLNDYNGVTQLTTLSGDNVTIKVTYWSCFNELDLRWEAGLVTIPQAFAMYKAAYQTVKAFNPDYIFTVGGLGRARNGFLRQLCEYDEDSDGLRFWDLFDVMDIHTYSMLDFQTDCKVIKELMERFYNPDSDNNFIDKPVWLTEYNYASYQNSDIAQAIEIPKFLLYSLGIGIEKAFIYECIDEYSRIDGDWFIKNPSEAFYGLSHRIYPDISYISYLRNDGSDDAISGGSDLKRVYFTSSQYTYLPLTTSREQGIINRLKASGLKIGGDGFTLIKVTLIKDYFGTPTESTLWSGSQIISSSNNVSLNASLFSTIETGDVIKIEVADKSVPGNTLEFEHKLGYKSIRFVQSLLKDSITRPEYTNINGVTCVTWKLSNNANVSYIWSTYSKYIKIEELSEDYTVYDYLGNIITIDTENYEISSSPICIINGSQISIV